MTGNVDEARRTQERFGSAYASHAANWALRPHGTPGPLPELEPYMGSIPDATQVSDISIAGTHNSLALSSTYAPFAQCQSSSLKTQLRGGIRALDVRLKLRDGSLKVYHGIAYQDCTFETVLRVVAEFLRENPTECVFIRVKEEDSSSAGFVQAVKDHLTNCDGNVYKPTGTSNPTLGQVRGKIVILQDRLGDDTLGIDFRALNIQDDWDPSSIDSKISKIVEHAANSHTCTRISANFLNMQWRHNRAIANSAERVNKAFIQKVGSSKGMVFCDYPTAELVMLLAISFN
eukprot:TRINITY_DN65657_c0_g2_i1.p1 TRINITY_DN65657_c0_g2~~TRINITY_DN65657_c0_g2_i1.p1  ORF type:complete len:335 (-),score=7.31 TRINITY_DN65657_c0_g2_i1:232-1098(-)